jgi:hypothetical protein
MAKESYTIKFDGFWREGNERDVPQASGIFCVFEARMVLATGQLKPLKLIYIGEADNGRRRITSHPLREEWKKLLGRDHHLCYSFAPVPKEARKRVAAAMIHHHKPPANTKYLEVFPYDRTNVLTAGKVAMLGSLVTVHRSKGVI